MKLHSFAFVIDAEDRAAGVNLSCIGPDGFSIHQDNYPTVDAAYAQARGILRDAGFVELETPEETPETPVETLPETSTPGIGADNDGPVQLFSNPE